MKENYNLSKNKIEFDIASINDETILFVEKEMTIKVLRNMHSNQVTAWIIVAVEQCDAYM